MRVYVLTPLTRRAVEQRRAVIQGFDVPWRTIKVLLIGFVPAVAAAALAWLAVGEYAVGVFLAVEAAVYWVAETRTRSGLRLRRYQALIDRQRARLGVFTVCGRPINPGLDPRVFTVVSSSAPVAPRDLSSAVTETMDSTRRPTRRRTPKSSPPPESDPWASTGWPGAAPTGTAPTPSEKEPVH